MEKVIRHLLVPYKVASSGNRLVLKKKRMKIDFYQSHSTIKEVDKKVNQYIFFFHHILILQTIEKLS